MRREANVYSAAMMSMRTMRRAAMVGPIFLLSAFGVGAGDDDGVEVIPAGWLLFGSMSFYWLFLL